ncbi:hypothetical protein KKC13_04225 [bacterium]|nr:hypothetical protein [bacterium]MBU1958304.1 hypothetical protein [bacterium]
MKTDHYQIEVTSDIFSPSINRGDVVYCSHLLEINNNSFVHCIETNSIMTYGEFKKLYPHFEGMTLSRVVGVQGALIK